VTAPTADIPVKLTAPQERIRAFIIAFVAERGYSPTIREIGIGAGYDSPTSALYQLQNLAELGVLTWVPGIPRSIVLAGERCEHCGAVRPQP
jgi:repressor LexA